MHLVHEAGKPSAVLKRAGLDPDRWWEWKKKYAASHPWLFDWLYCPKMDPPPGPAGEIITEAMHQFRTCATITAVAEAARRPRRKRARSSRAGRHVSADMTNHWRRKFGEYPWFERWLLRGEDSPAEARVTIATPDQVKRCSLAWHYPTLGKAAGLGSHTTYYEWLRSGLIPNLPWLRWLYGDRAPESVFVVPPSLVRLRAEKTVACICKASGVKRCAVDYWRKDVRLRGELEKAVSAAAAPGNPKWRQAGVKFGPETQDGTRALMLKYARKATLNACCRRAEMAVSDYYSLVEEAARAGAKEDLLRYLDSGGEDDRLKFSQGGWYTARLFVPPDLVRDFRETAGKLRTKERLSLLRGLVGFDEWFLDWVMPRESNGRRVALVGAVRAPGQPGAGELRPIPPESEAEGNRTPPQPPTGEPSPMSNRAPETAKGPRRRRGRPKDPQVKEREKKMEEAVRSGRCKTPRDLAQEFRVHRSTASRVINKVRKESVK
jgi:hypothetical protein